MKRQDRRKVLAMASGPFAIGGKTQRRGWYNDKNNCPPWCHYEDGRSIEWKSPNHPKGASFLTVK